MKKLLFVAICSLGSLTAFAQEPEEGQQQAQDATEQTAEVQDEFSAIEVEELPEAVSEAIKTNYPAASIDKASVNSEEQYKVEVSLEDGTSDSLYFDKDGNGIEM